MWWVPWMTLQTSNVAQSSPKVFGLKVSCYTIGVNKEGRARAAAARFQRLKEDPVAYRAYLDAKNAREREKTRRVKEDPDAYQNALILRRARRNRERDAERDAKRFQRLKQDPLMYGDYLATKNSIRNEKLAALRQQLNQPGQDPILYLPFVKQVLRGVNVRIKTKPFGSELNNSSALLELARRLSIGYCVVSGLPWDFTSETWLPSLDRIDNAKGYTLDNVRWVVWIFNRAKGRAVDADVMRLALALVKKQSDHETNEK